MKYPTFFSKAQQALQEQQARARGVDLSSFDVSNSFISYVEKEIPLTSYWSTLILSLFFSDARR